jgi:hypothetical protein
LPRSAAEAPAAAAAAVIKNNKISDGCQLRVWLLLFELQCLSQKHDEEERGKTMG